MPEGYGETESTTIGVTNPPEETPTNNQDDGIVDQPYDSDYSEQVTIPMCLSTTSTHNKDVDIILEIEDGMPHFDMKTYTDQEMIRYGHHVVHLTSGNRSAPTTF